MADIKKPKLVLSVENAVSAIIKTDFEVDWLKDDKRFRFSITDEQNAEIGKYSDTREEKIRSFITYVLNADPTPSWRRIISAIDQLDTDHAVASELYEYAEPITDSTLTPENVAAVLEEVESWNLICEDLKVPVIMTLLPKITLATLVLSRYHLANWIEISSRLFMYEQLRAVEATKKFLPISFQERNLEKSLTLENMCHSLNKEKWYGIATGIHISDAKRDEIWHQFNGDPDQCSKAAWKYWLENHPAPSWERIADGLFQINELDELKKIEKEYPTVISPAKRQIACQRAIKEKGAYHDIIVHGVCCGFPRAGKSSFKDRLVHRFRLDNNSTGVAEKVVRIEVMSTVLVEEQQWTEIGSTAEETTTVADKVTINISKEKPTLRKGSRDVPAVKREVTPTSKSGNSASNKTGTVDAPPLTVDPFQLIVSSSSDKPPEFPTFVAASQGVTLPRNYDKTWTHYMSDVGGQLEFQQLYPNLLTGPSLYYYTFKANQKFNEKYPVKYLYSGESYQYEASTTTRESILQFLASIASIQKMSQTDVGSPSKPKVLFIATHIDKLAHEDNQLSEIDSELQQIVRGTQAFKDDMIVFNTENRMLFPVDNLSKADEKVQRVRNVVNEVVTVNKEYHFDIPYTWAIFSFTIQNYPKQVIPYSTCIEIGKECGIETDQDLKECLWYLHHQTGILRYYGDVPALSHLVFKDTQYIFDKVTKLVTTTFTFDNVTHIMSIRENFVKKGIFSLEVFQKIHERLSSEHELISSGELIELLQHLRILAAYLKEGSETDTYFLPCSLVHADIKVVPESSPDWLPSLHFTFEIGFCPTGLFGALVADLLLSIKDLKDYKWCFEEDQVYRNQISFLVGPYSDRFQLTATHSFISADVTVHPNVPRLRNVSLAEMCCHVKTRLSISLADMTKKLNYDCNKTKCSLAFRCPGFREKTCHDAVHSAVITFDRVESACMLKCPYSPKDVLDLPENYKIWFEKDFIFKVPGHDFSPEGQAYVSSLPAGTGPHLKLLDWDNDVDRDLIEIAHKMLYWEEKLCTHLELTATDVHDIKVIFSNNPELQRREALRRWKNSQWLRATYGNLFELFVKAGQSQCAEAVLKVLRKKWGSPLSVAVGEKSKTSNKDYVSSEVTSKGLSLGLTIDSRQIDQIYSWSAAGFRLCLPTDQLSEDVNGKLIHLRTEVRGSYHFPPDFKLVSAIYNVTTDLKMDATLELEHCY